MTLYELVRRLRGRPPETSVQDTRPGPESMEAIRKSIEASDSLLEAVHRTMEALEQREKQ